MIAIRHTTAVMTFAAALALPGLVHAEEPVPPAGHAASTPSESPAAPPPGMGMGHGMGRGMGMGPMAAERCPARKAGMMGMQKPCRMADDALAEKRIEMLEKRLDAMQLTLELLVRQQAGGVGP